MQSFDCGVGWHGREFRIFSTSSSSALLVSSSAAAAAALDAGSDTVHPVSATMTLESVDRTLSSSPTDMLTQLRRLAETVRHTGQLFFAVIHQPWMQSTQKVCPHRSRRIEAFWGMLRKSSRHTAQQDGAQVAAGSARRLRGPAAADLPAFSLYSAHLAVESSLQNSPSSKCTMNSSSASRVSDAHSALSLRMSAPAGGSLTTTPVYRAPPLHSKRTDMLRKSAQADERRKGTPDAYRNLTLTRVPGGGGDLSRVLPPLFLLLRGLCCWPPPSSNWPEQGPE